MRLPYLNRVEAGQVLADALRAGYAGRENLLVLGLPRGGVPVAYEVAEELQAALDMLLVRKLGVPGREELAFGALALGGVRVLNDDVVTGLGLPDEVIDAVTQREAAELQRRERAYRDDRPPPQITGRCVIVIDDGLATGATMRAGVAVLRQQAPEQVVVAVPVAPPETVLALEEEADHVVCPATPEPFYGVGRWYEDFTQTTDDEVRALLARAWARSGRASGTSDYAPSGGRAPPEHS
ncbi:MAG: phosphoribosyltransferase [Planctomycetota bacterium]